LILHSFIVRLIQNLPYDNLMVNRELRNEKTVS
jgi:hypothetical protein